MSEKKIIDILKGAILLEHRGKSMYQSVVDNTKSDGVKDLFSFLVEEEEKHIRILEEQFLNIAQNRGFDLAEIESKDFTSSHAVLSDQIVSDVSGAGYEAALIAAALDFEKRAVEYYSGHALSAENNEEKKFYQWLATWETTHMSMLAELDKELKEQVWYDNKFWPIG